MTRAAEKLHLTPSALSMLIRSLEEELGVKLFERTTRSVVPTEDGTRFLSAARSILGQLDDSVQALQAGMREKAERIALATSPLLASTLMPASSSSNWLPS